MRLFTLLLAVSFVTNSQAQCVTNVTIGFASCNDPEQSMDILPTLNQSLDSLDYFIWLGDNVYFNEADWKSKEAMRLRYAEVFDQSAYSQILSKSNHLAIWDDHDAGPNNCNSTFEGIRDAMNVFKEFWKPQYPMPDPRSYYGVKSIAAGQIDLFFLDNRSFRTSKEELAPTILGKQQLNWLESAYGQSRATVKVVLLGGQLLNTAAVFENYAQYPEEREKLIQILADTHSMNIVLTGDRHSGEINKVTKNDVTILEATASPLTANVHPHHDELNSNRIHLNTTDTHNFGILELKFELNGNTMCKLQLIDAEGEVIFSHCETLSNSNVKN